jgi:hypothetical protein
MRRAMSAWNAGYHRPWRWRDAVRHFGLVALATLVVTMWGISLMTNVH